VLRLSDEEETAINLTRPSEIGGDSSGGALLLTGHEGSEEEVRRSRALVGSRLRQLGAVHLGEDPGTAWQQGRFHGPYLRDSLLDVGVLVETLETATFWSNLARLYADVKQGLVGSLTEQGTPPIVLCHVSHVYETGASLYFTVAAKQTSDPVAQWSAAKTAASEAMLGAGATITHHHAVGRDHKPWFAREIGPVGVQVLRAVKAELDPAGVLNPGVMVP
jgi:alkyldihydroxyacetonephosphate synthase